MALLQTKHMVADFYLQTPRMLADRRLYIHRGRALHCLIHAAGSALACLLVGLPFILLCAVASLDWALHYHIDFGKGLWSARAGDTPDDASYWRAFGADQLLHQLTYVALVWGAAQF
ncbi:DUF3307 domain-containing protein [Aliishimia ponticola]|nr:DUF3307 domain-containing protein [Aliishimia ponticola]